MSWRFLVAALLVAATVVAVPLAHATPTDQTWVAGLYDGADYDDVVNSVISASATTDCAGAPDLTPLEIVTQVSPTLQLAAPGTQTRSPYHRRAPPVA
jgi:hypothetical protein